MITRSHSGGGEGVDRRLIVVYCRVCERMFGKTISVMAGEAEQNGRWYGPTLCLTINWVLRDPDHCAQHLSRFNAFLGHKRFLLGVSE